MEEVRRILEELKGYDWVDPAVDVGTVVDGLWSGRRVAHMVMTPSERESPSFFMTFKGREAELLRELEEIGEGLRAQLPQPEPPAVELDRLERDFATTTGRTLELELRWLLQDGWGLWMCDLRLDGTPAGGRDVDTEGTTSEEMLADIADKLCEGWLHEEVWGGWPLCRRHPTRPLWAGVDEAGVATWACEADPTDRVRIGDLPA